MAELPKKICVVTGSRAEYGLLYWLMRDLDAEPSIDLQIVVTGMHLAAQFGATWEVIENDGFRISAKVPMMMLDDSQQAITKSVGIGVIGMADVLAQLEPDMVVILGDRFEIFAVTQASLFAGIPIAHIHGGEVTEGALDDCLRHAISKMSDFHFVASEVYRTRLIQMGEPADRIVVSGAPGLDHLHRLALLDRYQTEEMLGLPSRQPYFLTTYHPVTLDKAGETEGINGLLNSLSRFPDHHVIFTGVNADSGNNSLSQAVREYVADNPTRCQLYNSLGQTNYLSAMRHADAVIGNSSSGVIEAPAAGIPSVNIGTRQKGRLREASVIDCDNSADAIFKAITHACSVTFKKDASAAAAGLSDGKASKRIADTLKNISHPRDAPKPFVDFKGAMP